MLDKYLDEAMSRSRIEWLEESQVFYGEIPEIQGVWATGSTEEACQAELREVLEDWIILGRSANQHIPVISGIDVNTENVR